MSSYDSRSFYKGTNNFDTGDAIFVKGKGKGKGKGRWLDSLMRFLSGSSFTHAALLLELRGLWFVVETRKSSQNGYQLVPIDWWFARHQNDEIYLGKMPTRNSKITSNIKKIVMDPTESLRPYKLSWIFLTYVMQVWLCYFKPDLSKLYNNTTPLICSTLVQEAWERAGAIEPTNHMTPGCLINGLGGEAALLPFDYHNIFVHSHIKTNSDDKNELVPQLDIVAT